MHSDNGTDPKHCKTHHQFRAHLDQSRNCLFRLLRVCGCALLIPCWSPRGWVVAKLGRRWTWKLWRATCRRASRPVPSPRTVGGQAAVFVNVLRQSSEDIRLHVIERRLTPDLLDEIREFIDEECRRISVKIVSNRFTLSRSSSRRAIVCCACVRWWSVPCPIWTSAIVASSPRRCWRGWRLDRGDAPRGRFHEVDA